MRKIEVGKWKVDIGETKLVPEAVLNELETFLSTDWKEAAMKDIEERGTWWRGARELGIPSPIVRIDMAPNQRNSAKIQEAIYEVEIRPAGLGITLSLLPEIRDRWGRILKKSGCQGFVRLESPIQDDALAAKFLELPYFEEVPKNESLFWIRTRIDDPRALALEEKSLVPIRLDGHKGYLVKLNLARMVEMEMVEGIFSLPWEKGFAIKPLQGARIEGVELWLPQAQRGELPADKGLSTKNRVLRRIKIGGPYLLQPFIAPMEEERCGKTGWFIWRLFFGWEDSFYRFIGGAWFWRPNLRIHGASDAIIGPLEKEK